MLAIAHHGIQYLPTLTRICRQVDGVQADAHAHQKRSEPK